MPTVGNLLIMDRCASCQRELASTWKFCLYCGRPLVLASEVAPELGVDSHPELDLERELEAIPAAIRDESEPPPRRKYDGAFWVGVSMGSLGLVLIVYAAVQICGSQA